MELNESLLKVIEPGIYLTASQNLNFNKINIDRRSQSAGNITTTMNKWIYYHAHDRSVKKVHWMQVHPHL